MENLPNDSACEVGMAAACLLPHNDACASVLAHLPRLQALIQAVLNEALATPLGRLGGELLRSAAKFVPPFFAATGPHGGMPSRP